MPRLIDFLPLVNENVDSIRARLDADANAGVDPTSADFIDTTPGGFWFDITQAAVLEMARLWDMAATEVPAVAFPAYAWGDYLDDHADALGLTRKTATAASGVVRFTGSAGTVIAVGTEVSTIPVSSDDDPVSFVTTESGTISSTTVDVAVEAVSAGAAGNVGSNTITNLVSPNAGVSAVSNPSAMAGGSDVETDEDLRYRVLLKLRGGQGAGTIADYEQWALAYPGIASCVVTPVWDGGGTVHVVVTASGQGAVSLATKYGLQDQLDPPGFLTTSGGSGGTLNQVGSTVDVITTGDMANSGTFRIGTQKVTYTGKTGSTFTGCTIASGSYAWVAGERVSGDFGKGEGLAPIGAVVTVDTVTSVTVAVVATVTHASGYSLSGASGTIATEDDIVAAIGDYINALKPGDDVILNHVIGQFFRVPGVTDVSGVTLNASAANVSITDLQVAKLGTTTLT